MSPARPEGPERPEGNRRLFFALLGCAGLSLLALCVATGAGVFLLMREPSSAAAPAPGVAPGGAPIASPPVAPSPVAPATSAPAPRLRVSAVVTASSGAVAEGSRCLFDVELAVDATTACRAQVVCADKLLYGGRDAGYFPCTVTTSAPPSVSGRDAETTAQDGDAAMLLDTAARVLRVQDDAHGPHGAFTLEARVEDAR